MTAIAYGLLDHVNTVQARLDAIHIHEDLALPEVVKKAVINPASVGSTIVTAIADEDLRHKVSPCPGARRRLLYGAILVLPGHGRKTGLG